MKKSFSCFILVLSGFARAASLDRDLGQGLAYHRVHQLPADLPTAESTRKQPCVLDLRYVRGDADAAAALAAWLRFHATAHAPVFILANADTSPALLASTAEPERDTHVITIGGTAPGFTPALALKIAAEAERRAYDALEQGASVESLLTENSGKPRHDEASLVKEQPTETLGAVASPSHPSRSSAGTSAIPPPSPPLLDAALQRAVHLHRALLALKKI
ncbi:MAG: hypothetical protein EXS32_05930 [Opitutus sp.]|nr:hypothetical protein [Opitutus sp.]